MLAMRYLPRFQRIIHKTEWPHDFSDDTASDGITIGLFPPEKVEHARMAPVDFAANIGSNDQNRARDDDMLIRLGLDRFKLLYALRPRFIAKRRGEDAGADDEAHLHLRPPFSARAAPLVFM